MCTSSERRFAAGSGLIAGRSTSPAFCFSNNVCADRLSVRLLDAPSFASVGTGNVRSQPGATVASAGTCSSRSSTEYLHAANAAQQAALRDDGLQAALWIDPDQLVADHVHHQELADWRLRDVDLCLQVR